jgi:LIVCS family branched-chain amino acid:cation transporter
MSSQSFRKTILVAGFAMFSMFFGSGNLVFPLSVGFNSLDLYTFGAFGFIITAVLMPIVGLLSMVFFKGDRKAFFETLGVVPAFLLTLSLLALIGPFGVVPRCLTVAYGGLQLVMPSLQLWVFAIIFCTSIGIMIWKEGNVVDIIGKILSPIKMTLIVALMVFGIAYAPEIGISSKNPIDVFSNAIFQGYQTMDLVAAFFFSSATVMYIQQKQGENNLIKSSICASLIAALLIAIAYMFFTIIGASYAVQLEGVGVEQMLVSVSTSALGSFATPFVAATMAMATLVTAVILSSLFTEFLQKDICREKITRPVAVITTLAITFCVSLLGFGTITSILGFILETTYPALIALAVANIILKATGKHLSKHLFWSTLAATIGLKFFL